VCIDGSRLECSRGGRQSPLPGKPQSVLILPRLIAASLWQDMPSHDGWVAVGAAGLFIFSSLLALSLVEIVRSYMYKEKKKVREGKI
jgi:hypothetical protein